MLSITHEFNTPQRGIARHLPLNNAGAAEPCCLDEYLTRGTVRGIEAKEHVFAEGDVATSIFRILSGAVCLYKVLPDGRRQVVDFAFAGDIIGLEVGSVVTCNAQATVPTRVASVPAATIERAVSRQPLIAKQLYQTMARQVDSMRDHLVCVGQRSATERLVSFLLMLFRRRANAKGSDHTVELPMTRTDIADFLGLTIETVSRTLSKLKAQHCIEIDQGTTIRLKDMATLEALAEGEAF